MKSFAKIVFVSLFIFSVRSYGQSLPFGVLGGDALQTTVQFESLGPSIKTERDEESVTHGRLEVSVPVAQSDVDAYAIQFRTTRLTLDRDRVTSGAGVIVPRDLGSISIGPFGRRKLENGDMIAGDVQVGRSGIQLGSNATETTVSSNLFWARKKDADDGQWIYLLSYSNSRSTLNNIPVPGFAYMKSFKTESAQGLWVAGAPFFFAMIRAQPWSFTSLLTPFTSFIEGGYVFAGPFGVFARFGWQPQCFKVAGGPTERVVYEEFRTVLGVRGPIAKGLMASLGAAYSDGRRVAWTDSILRAGDYQSRLEDEISLYLSMNARF